jgi:diadenosine tetraphosphate (Ap4A) HIT family hydrolase
MSNDCFTCAVNAGRISAPGGVIYQDKHWVAEHGVDRLVKGYVVLKPRRHVHEMADLLPQEARALGPAMRTLLSAMRTALAPERIYVCSFAESVHHLHFHLIPRYADMPGLGPHLVPALFEERWGCTPEEAGIAAAGIRAAL